MRKTACVAILCLGTGLALPAAAQGQQGSQQFGQQQFGQQPSQQLTEQQVRNFFDQAERVLQQTARTQDPAALRQYLNTFLADDAVITSATQLFLGDRHVATTVADATNETVTEALGYAATALQGRKLVSDYGLQINVTDIQMLPGQNAARVSTEIQESGILSGPVAQRVSERAGEARQRSGEMRRQWGQSQSGQPGQNLQQGWGQTQSGSAQGSGTGVGEGRGGAPEQQGIRFQSRADCTHNVRLEQGQIRLGNTFCRGEMRLGT